MVEATTDAVAEETTHKHRKTVLDYLSEEDYARYSELMTKAAEAKAAAPKTPRKFKERTPEQQKAALLARMQKAQAQLDALLAAEGIE